MLPVYHTGEDWMEAAVTAAGAKLPVFSPQGLSTVTWAFATLAFVPPVSWQQQLCGEAVAQVSRGQFFHTVECLSPPNVCLETD